LARLSAPEKHMARTRILVVDEHPLLRHGIIAFINGQPDMIACGEADSVPTVQNQLAETKPRLVLIGLRLGAGDSLELLKAIKAQIPDLLVLVYSAFEETIFAERALRAGAQGYVMKKAPKEELLAAIRDIVQGRIYVSRDVAMRAFKKSLETRSEYRLSRTASAVQNLSDREMHIFHLLGSGVAKRQIAHSLNLSVKTIESHRENIKRKLSVNSSRELVDRATRYVEETFLPPSKELLSLSGKKKVVRFPAA